MSSPSLFLVGTVRQGPVARPHLAFTHPALASPVLNTRHGSLTPFPSPAGSREPLRSRRDREQLNETAPVEGAAQ